MGTNTPRRPLVSIAGADVRIDGRRILSDIRFELEPGTHWGIVGPNGSGKSTLLALIAGLRWPAPSSGPRAYDFGAGPLSDAVEARRRIALISPELQDRYTKMGWNFTALNVVLSGVTRSDTPRRGTGNEQHERATRALAAAGAGELASRPFLELSRGEQRRVLVARALCFEPRILVLDEPASGLDAASRLALDETIGRAAKTMSIVAAAHCADALPTVITHLLHMRDGRIVAREALSDTRGTDAQIARQAAAAVSTGPTRPKRDALIEVGNADVWRGSSCVLRAIDWRLAPGEHWLVTGHNGAGKSSLLRLLHGQLRPAMGGTIAWPGLGNPRDVWALRKEVAWVSAELQAAYLFPSTVYETVASGLTSSIGLTRRPDETQRERVASLLATFELESLRDRAFATLSYGQKRRALIARALANAPRVVLLDEPWEGLDAPNTRLVCAALERARTLGTQLVCASHLGDFGLDLPLELVLERGRITSAGPRQM